MNQEPVFNPAKVINCSSRAGATVTVPFLPISDYGIKNRGGWV
jgi:hypothetical protein